MSEIEERLIMQEKLDKCEKCIETINDLLNNVLESKDLNELQGFVEEINYLTKELLNEIK